MDPTTVAVSGTMSDQDGATDLDAAVSAARAGDERAFTTLYRALQPGLLRYLFALVKDDAEDVAGESWLQITRDLDRFRGDWREFRAWAVTIARHRAMDHLRHHGRRPSIPVPIEEMTSVAGADDTAARAVEELSTRDAVALIAGLPRDQAEAVLLRVVVGLDATTAGRVLGKRAGAVRTATYRGLRRLAQELAPESTARPATVLASDVAVTQTLTPTLKEVR